MEHGLPYSKTVLYYTYTCLHPDNPKWTRSKNKSSVHCELFTAQWLLGVNTALSRNPLGLKTLVELPGQRGYANRRLFKMDRAWKNCTARNEPGKCFWRTRSGSVTLPMQISAQVTLHFSKRYFSHSLDIGIRKVLLYILHIKVQTYIQPLKDEKGLQMTVINSEFYSYSTSHSRPGYYANRKNFPMIYFSYFQKYQLTQH